MASLIKAHEDAADLDVCKLLMMVAIFSNGSLWHPAVCRDERVYMPPGYTLYVGRPIIAEL
jgi:hypothetical protein